jgi:hypothetical protein
VLHFLIEFHHVHDFVLEPETELGTGAAGFLLPGPPGDLM